MKKQTKIILIIMAFLVLLYFIFIYINYNRVKKGKAPIFQYYTFNVSDFDVQKPDSSYYIPIANKDYTVYSMLGYKIVKCDECDKKVYIMPLGIGTLPSEYLNCTSISNSKYGTYHVFREGYLDTIENIKVLTSKEYSFEKDDVLDLNNTTGCYETQTENIDQTYTIISSCNLSQMTDEDIEKVYGQNREALKLTKKKLIKLYKSENSDMTCKIWR